MEKREPNEHASASIINPYLKGGVSGDVDYGLDRKGRGGWAKHGTERSIIMERVIPERMVNMNHAKMARLLNCTSQKYAMIHPYLSKGSRVLDLCAGAGFGSMLMARSGYDVTAVDYFTDILEYRTGIDVYNANLLEEDISPLGQFDAVTMIDCIEHFELEGQRDVMAQALSVLKPGGILLIDTPTAKETARLSREHLRVMTWEDFGSLVEENFQIDSRYYIEWVAETFALMVESNDRPAPDRNRVHDQLIIARRDQ